MRKISRARGPLATLVPFALAAACGDPELASELDSEGPPEVVEVAVSNETASFDPNGNNWESATFCRDGEDYKVSTFYCPLMRDNTNAPIQGMRVFEMVDDARPIGWYASFVFTELLDGDIEDVEGLEGGTALAASDPFILTCGGVEQEYIGWYDPTGNHLSYPAGPRLVAQGADFVATGSECEVALRDGVVVDKDGEAVPSDQLGPYAFVIAPLSVAATTPADMDEGVTSDSTIDVAFNAPIDFDTAGTRITVSTGGTPIAGAFSVFVDPDTEEESPEIITFTPDSPLAPNTSYTIEVADGITDIAGGALDQGDTPFTASFVTGEE
jgi:Bacterial Ig-like domain